MTQGVESSSGCLRVLAVDDEPAILALICEVLAEEGHEVVCASNGRAALAAAAETEFDVAVVDHVIPAPNGLAVLRQLRRSTPRCIRILMSGHVDLPLALDAVNRGEVARVMPKPFDPFGLLLEINELASSRQHLEAICRFQVAAEASEECRMLDDCLRGSWISLAYQPIVRALDREVVAHEALLRTSHPELRTPADILDLAEKHRRLNDVAWLVARSAGKRFHELPENTLLFLNVHPAELLCFEDLAARLQTLLPFANRTVLEITEHTDLSEHADIEKRLEKITSLGFQIAVDDLGSGYNSLSALANLKPRYIKIDMSIVRGVDREPRKRRLIELLCSFAESVGASTIAEGVQTPDEADALSLCGATLLQGYLFGRPEPRPLTRALV